MANDLFDKIAPVYGKFFNYQVKHYRRVLDEANASIYIPEHSSFLDIGCGTGAFCYALNEHGYNVTGIDVAPSMIKQAKEYTRKVKINFIVDDVLTGLDFKNKSFDIVISSYVAHGMNKADRKKLYQESARLAKDMIIFHDYNMKRYLITDIAEWLEGGDYFNFINIAESEMREYFGKVKVINVGKSAAWYIIVM